MAAAMTVPLARTAPMMAACSRSRGISTMMRNIGPSHGDRRIIVLIPLPRVASQNHNESLVEPLRPPS